MKTLPDRPDRALGGADAGAARQAGGHAFRRLPIGAAQVLPRRVLLAFLLRDADGGLSWYAAPAYRETHVLGTVLATTSDTAERVLRILDEALCPLGRPKRLTIEVFRHTRGNTV